MSSRHEIPRFVEPMLARPGPVPDGDDWALEVKFDGMRGQVRWDGHSLCVRSRPGRDCTAEFHEPGWHRPRTGKRTAILDGELVCLDTERKPSFERLRGRLRLTGSRAGIATRSAPATFLAFDLMYLDGRSLLDASYAERRELLRGLDLEGPAWRTPRNFVGQVNEVVATTRAHGLEGVAKRLDSPYKPGFRNGAWGKHKHRRTEAFLITAWAPRQAKQPESFMLARQLEDGGLERAGSVELGLAGEARDWLRSELVAAELPHRRRNQRVRPVQPTILATVDFHGPEWGAVRDAVLRAVKPAR